MSQTSRTVRMAVVRLVATVIVLLFAACGASAQAVFFDDFNYQSSSDPALLNFGWSPRTGGGGPGIGTWDATHITFIPDPADSTNQLMQMAATTSGTARCWGDNSIGELGSGNTLDSNVPVGVVGLG